MSNYTATVEFGRFVSLERKCQMMSNCPSAKEAEEKTQHVSVLAVTVFSAVQLAVASALQNMNRLCRISRKGKKNTSWPVLCKGAEATSCLGWNNEVKGLWDVFSFHYISSALILQCKSTVPTPLCLLRLSWILLFSCVWVKAQTLHLNILLEFAALWKSSISLGSKSESKNPPCRRGSQSHSAGQQGMQTSPHQYHYTVPHTHAAGRYFSECTRFSHSTPFDGRFMLAC